MPTIKNYLTETIQLKEKEITELLEYTEANYRIDKANIFYDQVLRFPKKEIGSDRFVELVYETLKVWNMDNRGAKLTDFETFKNSLQENNDVIQSLAKLRIEKLKETDNQLKETIKSLFQNLKLVKTNSPLVTFSKTMHFFLPNLFMPVDRKYTIKFFHTTISSSTSERQFQNFCKIFEQFRQFANENRSILEAQIDPNSRWNKNIPKIIDNIIIAYMKHVEK
jgi:hypothetical protein